MRAFLLLFLVGLISSGSGQTKLADSLWRELNTLKDARSENDTAYLIVLNEFAYSIQYSNPDSSLLYAEQAKKLSREAGFEKGYAEAVRNIGIVHYLRGNYVKGLEYFYDGLKVAEKIGYEKGVARLHNNIALIYYGQAKYKEALASQFKALAIREKIGDRPGIATSLNNIANIYKNLNQYDESLVYHVKSLGVKRALNDTRAIAASLNNIGWLFIKQNKYIDAQQYLEEAKPLLKKSQDKILSSDVLQGLAECYWASGNFTEALTLAQQSLQIAHAINLKDQLRDCNETISKIYKVRGDFKSALRHHEIFKLYADSINNAEIEKKTSALAVQYEFEKKEAVLKAEQDKVNLEHEKQNLQQRWIIITVAIGLFMVSVVAFLFFRSRNNMERAYHKLEIANQEIQTKSEQLRLINQALQLQKEEISQQRDVVAAQNQKLNEANAIIGSHNIVLEHEVDRRTKELSEYARQLEEFAFITAHDLRSPVATILGLGNLMEQIGGDAKEREMIYEKLILTAKVLDETVKGLNRKLNTRSKGPAYPAGKPVPVSVG
jgi:tetratricopeptide (TPR) repeat protein